MIGAVRRRWLNPHPLKGWQALFCAIVAVALPTIVRVAVNGTVTGCEFTPYLPFVLISAILLRWWQAAVVALGSAAVLGGLFGGSASYASPCFAEAAGIFLIASAIMLGIAALARRFITTLEDRGVDEAAGGIIFSLEKGEVWASWYGHALPMRLGSQSKVSAMMEDFLAQVEVGKRLNRR